MDYVCKSDVCYEVKQGNGYYWQRASPSVNECAGDPIGHVKLIGIVAFYELLTVNLTCFFPVSKTLP